MKPFVIKPYLSLKGTIVPPGDKSISHRAAILSALVRGRTIIRNFSFSDDCLVTLRALEALGVKVTLNKKKREVAIVSCGYLRQPKVPLDMKESGTSCRIFLGLLAGQDFKSTLIGAPTLVRRPMHRVIEPLRRMGASIKAQKKINDEFLPIKILPSGLCAIQWTQKIASAQVKSAILFAGLFADGETIVCEPVPTRDHTERCLKLFRADIKVDKDKIRIRRSSLKSPGSVLIPGDISSAAFFIVAGLITTNSKIIIKNVGANPGRMGAVNVLKRMGGNIQMRSHSRMYEPMADFEVISSELRATVIKASEIPFLIDELPILMVAASLAKGKTIIEGAEELRVKETDRIMSMVSNLMKLDVNIRVKSLNKKELIEIDGADSLKPAGLRSFGDHRTAMSMVIAGLTCGKPVRLDDISCIKKSFPEFLAVLNHLVD
jgi:3-phosphoshikimate 1-carboxyvinyltransferase